MDEEIIKQINQIFNKYCEVNEVILYGSRAKGNYRPGSDYDLTLKGKNVNLYLLNQISLEIDDLLLPNKFDISIYYHIKNKDLIDHINRVGKVIYSKK